MSSLWLKIAIGFALALAIAYLIPGGHGGNEPPVRSLLLSAILIALFTTGALYLGLRRDLGFTARVAMYAVAYNALIVGVKFALAPHGLYEVNRSVDLTSLFNVTDQAGAIMVAACVFVLYFAAYLFSQRAGVRRRLTPFSRPRSSRFS